MRAGVDVREAQVRAVVRIAREGTVSRQVLDELGLADLPVLLSDYERGATGMYQQDLEFGRVIIEQIAMVPTLVSNCAIISTDGLAMQDDHHFNMTGYREWSRRALDLLQQHGWSPWSH